MLAILNLILPLLSQAAGTCIWADGSFAKAGKASWMREGHDSEVYWASEKTELPAYLAFQKWVAPLPDLKDPLTRIQNMIAAYTKDKNTFPRDREILLRNFAMITQGEVGRLRDSTCMETLLFAEAIARQPMFEQPYELGAVVLRKPDGLLKVYLLTGKATYVNFGEIEPFLLRDLKQGWQLALNLHSHPFSPKLDAQNLGGYTAPSTLDLRFYSLWRESYQLETGIVTNGVFSFELPLAELGKLEKD